MKNTIIILYLILISTVSIAQDRTMLTFCTLKDLFKYDNSKASYKETTKWITEKLNKYIVKEYSQKMPDILSDGDILGKYITTKIEYYDIKIEDSLLMIGIQGTSKVTYRNEEKFARTIIIPLNDLERVSVYPTALYFTTFDNTIRSYADSHSTDKYLTNTYILEMDFRKEDKIDERLIKAFVHLNKFFWRKIPKQTF